jgi:adenylate cyclase
VTPDDEDTAVLLSVLDALGADPAKTARARADGRLSALVVETAATGGAGVPFAAAAAASGLTEAAATRFWRGLGFPDPRQDDPALLPDEVRMLELLGAAAGDLLGDEATLRLARVIGEATGRVAEAVVGAFREQVEAPSRSAGGAYAETVRAYAELGGGSLPALQEAVGACLRRHVVVAAAGSWSLEEGGLLPRRDLALGFADLVGWTERTRDAPSALLATLVHGFERVLADTADATGVRVLKHLGDGAMFVSDDAANACAFGLALVDAVRAEGDLPPVRVGLSAGLVVPSDGDVHGAPVIVAARLAGAAPPWAVLADEEVQRRAPAAAFSEARSYDLKGLPQGLLAAFVQPRDA